jgi:hypothetical protein
VHQPGSDADADRVADTLAVPFSDADSDSNALSGAPE